MECVSIPLTEQEQWPDKAAKSSGLCLKFPFDQDHLSVLLLNSGSMEGAGETSVNLTGINSSHPFSAPAEMKNSDGTPGDVFTSEDKLADE